MANSTNNRSTQDDPRAEQWQMAARDAVVKRAGEAAIAGSWIEAWDPEGDEPYTAFAARVASVRGAAEAVAVARLRSGATVEQLVAEMGQTRTTRAALSSGLTGYELEAPAKAIVPGMPAPTAKVPVTVSSIVRPPVVSAPALSGGEAPLSGTAWAHRPHDHPHGGFLFHGDDGSHSHRHTHLDGTTHDHPHQHGHDHHNDHPDDGWRLAGSGSSSGHSHPHVHPHDHEHAYRAGEPVDARLAQPDSPRSTLPSSGKVSNTGTSVNAGYSADAIGRPPVGSAAQMAAAGKSKPLAQTVVPSVVGHRDLMNTEDAAALDFGMPEPLADDAVTPTPDDSIQLDPTTLHPLGYQPQGALGQSSMQIPRADNAADILLLRAFPN